MDVLEIDNVALNFGFNEVLKAIYFKAIKGEITGVLGSNGSGKSSLLKIIFGSLIPKSKLIRLDGKPIISPLYKKGIITYLPQFSIFPSSMSLRKGLLYYNVSKETFLLNFPDYKLQMDLRFSELSGGEKRLVETYILLKSSAEIVLLDEPFSHLAPLYIKKLKTIILEEKKHKIIIITDHLYKDVLDVSDTTYLVKEGWIRELKSSKELIRFKYINQL